MSGKSSEPLPRVSPEKNFRRKLRDGQAKLAEALKWWDEPQLNVKWPGGYGKSLGIALGFRSVIEKGTCNRLLVIVANDTQRKQMVNDFRHDCLDVGVHVDHVWQVTNEPSTFRANRKNKAQVFVTTIQHLSRCLASESNTVLALMRDHGDWIVAADEYHHYAVEADWGNALVPIVEQAIFTLAMSATPDRDGSPTIFGSPEPSVSVAYRDARDEGAVKYIVRRCYDYRVDYIDRHGEPVQFQTEDLRSSIRSLGLSVSEFEAKQNLRYSSKYVLPIVHEPINRLIEKRIRFSKPVQMLVRAMTCDHAAVVCEQVRAVAGDLRVDWIGTGPNGRTDFENEQIKRKFCPPKDKAGNRPAPDLDVLVQVGMADEGFDSILVAEIVDLAIVTLNGAANRTKQFYKRGTRFVTDGLDLHINVGTDHPIAGEGDIEDWIDSCRPISAKEPIDGGERPEPGDWDFPDEDWFISQEELTDCQLKEIIVDPRFQQVVKNECDFEPTDEQVKNWFRKAMRMQAEEDQEELSLSQMRSKLDQLAGKVAYSVVKQSGEFEKSALNDTKKRINGRMRRAFGERKAMLKDELMQAFNWLKGVHESVQDGDCPVWLSAGGR